MWPPPAPRSTPICRCRSRRACATLEKAFELLGAALIASAPNGAGAPTVVIVSDGESNSAWYEHQEIARRLELPIVRVADLTVRRNRLHAPA